VINQNVEAFFHCTNLLRENFMTEMYRQGDVLLVKAAMPRGAQKHPVDRRIVLALGEASGHAHAIDASFADLYSHGLETFVMVKPGAQLVHEEHASIPLTPGAYKLVLQREFLPVGTRNVLD
jgi:hypothetical protein